MTRTLAAALIVLAVMVRAAAAQGTDGAVEVAAGTGIFGVTHFTQVNANESQFGGRDRTVFAVKPSLDASAGLAVRVGVRVTPRIAAESTLSLNHTRLSAAISGDVENVPDSTASEPITQYLIEGGLRVGLHRPHAARFEPFLTGGGGYLRQLHDGQTLVDTGRTIYGGIGGHYWLRRGGTGWVRSAGLRLDARATVFSGGAATDGGSHVAPTFGAAFFLGF